MKLNVKFKIGRSKTGIFHAPLLALGFGPGGCYLCVLGVSFILLKGE